MKKRRERALHLFQLTGRERAVNRLQVDKVRQGIVQKNDRASFRYSVVFYRAHLWSINDEARMTTEIRATNGPGRTGVAREACALPGKKHVRFASRLDGVSPYQYMFAKTSRWVAWKSRQNE